MCGVPPTAHSLPDFWEGSRSTKAQKSYLRHEDGFIPVGKASSKKNRKNVLTVKSVKNRPYKAKEKKKKKKNFEKNSRDICKELYFMHMAYF